MTPARRALADRFAPDGLPHDAFAEDAGRAIAELRSDDPYRARSAVRAMIALVEASVQSRRAFLFTGLSKAQAVRVSPAERLVLREEQAVLKADGSVAVVPKFYALPEMLRLVFTVSARVIPRARPVDWKASGWRDLREAIAIRNRISHPRHIEDAALSKKDLLAVLNGMSWFLSIDLDLTARTQGYLKRQIRAQGA